MSDPADSATTSSPTGSDADASHNASGAASTTDAGAAAAAAVDPAAIANQAASAALKAQQDAQAAADAAKAKADAQTAADAAKAAADAQTAASDAATAADVQAQVGKLQKQLLRQATLAALPGLDKPDTFLPLVMDKVSLDDNGALTADSVTALEAFKTEHHYLFAAGAGAAGTTPGSAAGHRAAAGSFDSDDQASMDMMNVPRSGAENHYSKKPAHKALNLIFGKVGHA